MTEIKGVLLLAKGEGYPGIPDGLLDGSLSTSKTGITFDTEGSTNPLFKKLDDPVFIPWENIRNMELAQKRSGAFLLDFDAYRWCVAITYERPDLGMLETLYFDRTGSGGFNNKNKTVELKKLLLEELAEYRTNRGKTTRPE